MTDSFEAILRELVAHWAAEPVRDVNVDDAWTQWRIELAHIHKRIRELAAESRHQPEAPETVTEWQVRTRTDDPKPYVRRDWDEVRYLLPLYPGATVWRSEVTTTRTPWIEVPVTDTEEKD